MTCHLWQRRGGGTLAHTLAPSGTAKRTRSTTCPSSTRVPSRDRGHEPRAHRHGQRDPRRWPSAEPDGV